MKGMERRPHVQGNAAAIEVETTLGRSAADLRLIDTPGLVRGDAASVQALATLLRHARVTEDLDDRARAELMAKYLGADGAAREVAAKPKLRPNARIRVLPTRALSFNIAE